MKYGQVPHFDRPISRMVVGSMLFGLDNLDVTFEALDTFVELGGNCIDLAHCYGPQRQQAVGKYLKARGRDTLILFDKGCHPYGKPRVTQADLKADITENHERLQVETTEFFTLHRDDESVPVGEIIEWLNEEKRAGRILLFGASNWHHSRIIEANDYATAHGLQGFSASSPGLSLATANEPMWGGSILVDEVAKVWYEHTQFPLFAWSSAANGFFARRESDDISRVYNSEINFARRDRVDAMAAKKGVSPTQLAVAWVLNQPLEIFALVGPANAAQVTDNLAAIDINLTAEELSYLENGPE